MKKLVLSLCSLILIAGTLIAQDASSAYKAGQKAFRKYQADPSSRESLDEAAGHLDIATAGASALEGKTLTKMLILAGQVYNEVASMDTKSSLTEGFVPTRPMAAFSAYEALSKAFKVADKKYFKSDALEYLRTTSAHLSNAGLFAFQDGKYENALKSYEAVSALNEMLVGNDKKPVLDDETKKNDHDYMTGLSAMQAGKMDVAETLFTKLKDNNYADGAVVYNALVNINMEKDAAKAETLLAEGRKKYPEDQSLMVTELNHYLNANRFDELVDKLKGAIAADPENVSYYSALGNTYDNLFQREMAAKNLTKADEYFQEAMKYYGQALEKDDKYFFAIYNSGVLFVNKANLLIEELKIMEDKGDYSKTALRAMEEKKSSINTEFEKSLPYFQRAEALNPNDINTLSALKEIYARKEDFDLSKEFGKRMEIVNGGGENTSYFAK